MLLVTSQFMHFMHVAKGHPGGFAKSKGCGVLHFFLLFEMAQTYHPAGVLQQPSVVRATFEMARPGVVSLLAYCSAFWRYWYTGTERQASRSPC